MIYLEEYKAYYMVHGDTNMMRPTFSECKDNGDETYTLIYTSSNSYKDDEKFAVTIKAVGDTYQIISNIVIQ